jgi:hypothetical protein
MLLRFLHGTAGDTPLVQPSGTAAIMACARFDCKPKSNQYLIQGNDLHSLAGSGINLKFAAGLGSINWADPPLLI